jgi:hypothetical protein
MKKLYLIVFIILSLTCCEEENCEIDIPACIEKKIEEIKMEEVRNPPAQVWRWEVDEQTYYYITSDCCDQYNYLYDENCNVVCAPDGGISGMGDENCPDFVEQIEKTLVWEDSRN